jgi:hypothetical protein
VPNHLSQQVNYYIETVTYDMLRFRKHHQLCNGSKEQKYTYILVITNRIHYMKKIVFTGKAEKLTIFTKKFATRRKRNTAPVLKTLTVKFHLLFI